MKFNPKNIFLLLILTAGTFSNLTQTMERVRERLGVHLSQEITAQQIQDAARCPICHADFSSQEREGLHMIRCGNHRVILHQNCLQEWEAANPEVLRCMICTRQLLNGPLDEEDENPAVLRLLEQNAQEQIRFEFLRLTVAALVSAEVLMLFRYPAIHGVEFSLSWALLTGALYVTQYRIPLRNSAIVCLFLAANLAYQQYQQR